jgi:hypothetical protein
MTKHCGGVGPTQSEEEMSGLCADIVGALATLGSFAHNDWKKKMTVCPQGTWNKKPYRGSNVT